MFRVGEYCKVNGAERTLYKIHAIEGTTLRVWYQGELYGIHRSGYIPIGFKEYNKKCLRKATK